MNHWWLTHHWLSWIWVVKKRYQMKWEKKWKEREWTVNNIRSQGANSLSESLMVNSSLTELNLSGSAKDMKWKDETKEEENEKRIGNQIGPEGGVSFRESLKINTTLTSLDLSRIYNVLNEKEFEENDRNEQKTNLELWWVTSKFTSSITKGPLGRNTKPKNVVRNCERSNGSRTNDRMKCACATCSLLFWSINSPASHTYTRAQYKPVN